MENKKQKFIFKVLSIGSFELLMHDEITMMNRPCIFLDDERKKWGNEYLLYSADLDDMVKNGNKCFLGIFGIDSKHKANIRLIKVIDAPIRPDYFVITLKHDGEKLDKMYDLKKVNPTSFSKIFSSAYHRGVDDGYDCETIFVVQHGDEITINDRVMKFSAKSEEFI